MDGVHPITSRAPLAPNSGEPSPAAPDADRAGDAARALPYTRHADVPDDAPAVSPLQRFLSRYGTGYGITPELIARQLRLPPALLDELGSAPCPPPWLPLALAGIGIAHGVPASELGWLLSESPRPRR